MVVLYESGREEAEVFLGDLKAQIENFNKYSKSSPISYAHGYAVSGGLQRVYASNAYG